MLLLLLWRQAVGYTSSMGGNNLNHVDGGVDDYNNGWYNTMMATYFSAYQRRTTYNTYFLDEISITTTTTYDLLDYRGNKNKTILPKNNHSNSKALS
jgi:hypothetical protein